MGAKWLFVFIYVVLSANDEKIEFKQVEIEFPIQEVLYCGLKKETILLKTEEKSVFRSENSGYSWKPVSIFSEPIKEISKIVQSPADSKLLAFLGAKGKNYYSEDCGKTLKTLNYEKPMEDFQFHPKMKNWGLAGSWTKCSDFEEGECKKYRVLYKTKDLGNNWEPILDYVVQFSWGTQGLSPEITKNFPMERIYVTRNNNPEGDQKVSGWNYGVDFIRSDDFFASSEVIVPHGNKFLLADKFVLVASAVENDSEEVQLAVSNGRNIESFSRIELPVKKIPEHSYTLLDTSEGSIFLHVNHYGPRSNYGTIYISDAFGKRFSVSLLHNVRDRSGFCDFDKVKGLEGIYIANIYDKDHLSEDTANKKNKKDNLRFQKTMITFDKGGEWKFVEAPERDSNGKRIICEEDCSLHLHSVTSSFASVYSTENAVGIIMGIGNVGSYLSYKEDELNTYLSRDGGLTWSEVKKGVFIYEMGDHGAIIVMADSQKETDVLYYSWNEGLTWEKLLIDAPLEIENILIEPTATSQKFLVYGEKGGKGVTVSIDFSSFHEPLCKNPSKAGSSDSDYEVWAPNDGRSGSCLMGRKVEYVRRKQEAECFNGEEFERPKFIENCECTEEDYECDLGYYRETGGSCTKIESYKFEDPVCDENDYIEVSSGYRRVAGNTCVGGVSSSLEPSVVLCTNTFGRTGYMILAVILAAVIVVVLKQYGDDIKAFTFTWTKEQFDRTGFFSDLTKVPEGMDSEELEDNKPENIPDEEEFDPRA